MTHLSHRRGFVLAGTLASLLVAAGPAAAQQQTPLPPGSPLIGRPDTDAAKQVVAIAASGLLVCFLGNLQPWIFALCILPASAAG